MIESGSQDTVIATVVTPPALTNSTLNTPRSLPADVTVRDIDTLLPTPSDMLEGADTSTSFVISNNSYDVMRFSNPNDVVPEWEDDEVEEIMVLSPKAKSRGSTVRIIPADSSIDSRRPDMHISSFQCLQGLSSSSTVSRVSLARHTHSNTLYAVKTFSKAQLFYDAPKLEAAMTEQMLLKLLTQMDVSFVPKLRWSFQDKDGLYLVTDFCSGGDLQQLITQSTPFHPSHARFYAAELVDVLVSLHNSGITHCAIRPDHVLIGGDGHIVLTGFSNATISGPVSPRGTLSPSVLGQSRTQQPTYPHSAFDVNEWSAPEIILGWDRDGAVDSWGFGMVLYFMLTGQHPFLRDAGGGIQRAIAESMLLHAPLCTTDHEDVISTDAYSLLIKTLHRNPRLRVSIEDVKSHALLANTNWDRLRSKGYHAPLTVPPYNITGQATEETLGPSESLSGVRITGFDFSFNVHDFAEPSQTAMNGTTLEATFISQNGDLTDIRELDIPRTPGAPRESESSNVSSNTVAEDIKKEHHGSNSEAPDDSLSSGAPSAKSGVSAPSASTALYSCTSFGELREALKMKEATQDQRTVSSPSGGNNDSSSGIDSGIDGSSGSGSGSGSDLALVCGSRSGLPSPGRLQCGHLRNRPVGIMRKTDSLLFPANARTAATRGGSNLGCGRGLRKYASLNFDLDTVVSLDADLCNLSMNTGDANSSADMDNSQISSFLNKTDSDASASALTPPAMARRRVSFLDAYKGTVPGSDNVSDARCPLGSTAASTPTPTPKSTCADGMSPSWKSLNLNASAVVTATGNKLRKKRVASTPTPVLPNTPHLHERAMLPAGLEQIGLGIGYTYTRPAQPGGADREKDKDKGLREKCEKSDLTKQDGSVQSIINSRHLETPRRSVSLGIGIGVGTLFANLRKGRRTTYGNYSAVGEDDNQVGRSAGGTTGDVNQRTSGESDAMEAVMKELYGGAWDTEIGVAGYGCGHNRVNRSGGAMEETRRMRAPGRVYSVHADQTVTDSTLRLVEPPRKDDI